MPVKISQGRPIEWAPSISITVLTQRCRFQPTQINKVGHSIASNVAHPNLHILDPLKSYVGDRPHQPLPLELKLTQNSLYNPFQIRHVTFTRLLFMQQLAIFISVSIISHYHLLQILFLSLKTVLLLLSLSLSKTLYNAIFFIVLCVISR